MSTHHNRKFHIQTFSSLVPDNYFAQVYDKDRTRVVHETGLYSSRKHAAGAADQWARYSKSALAKSLTDDARIAGG